MKPYNMTMCHKLLYSLRVAGIQPDVAAAFFGQQVSTMQNCPPNYTPKNNNSRMKFTIPFWIMRGYFPNTPFMFKIVMVNDQFSRWDPDTFYANVKLIVPTIQYKHGYQTQVTDKDVDAIINNFANNALVGDTVPDSKIVLTQRNPKCMSPKGAVIHHFKMKGT